MSASSTAHASLVRSEGNEDREPDVRVRSAGGCKLMGGAGAGVDDGGTKGGNAESKMRGVRA